MGFRIEETMESPLRNSNKDEMTGIPKSPTPTVEGSGDEDERDCDILEFVMLMEISESSEAMKGLLLKILNSNKADLLKPYLKERPQRKSKKSARRSSMGDGASPIPRNSTKKSTRKSIDQGTRTITAGALTKLNGAQVSPGSLRRSRQSEGCLRKSQPVGLSPGNNQKSRLLTSSSLLQLRTAQRGSAGKRRPMTNQDDSQVQKQNSSWDPVPGGMKMNKHASTGSFMRPAPISPDSNRKNANWGSAVSPSRGVEAIEKLRKKALLMKAANERRNSVGAKVKNTSDHSNSDLSRSSRSGHTSKKRNGSDHQKRSTTEPKASSQNNGFAQFDFGQVAYCENKVSLTDLVDLNSPKSSIRAIQEVDDTSKSKNETFNESGPEKKGLRKYLKKQLTKRNVGKDNSESLNDKYASLCDDNKFRTGDLPIAS